MKISGCLRQHEIFQVSCIGRFYSVGKTRGPKEGPIHSGRYELPLPDYKETCKGQNKKSRQHKAYLDKRMKYKGTASVHGRIKVAIT
jgi:hypothetical protein